MKKLIGVIIFVLLLIVSFTPKTFAATVDYEKVNKMVDETNKRIEKSIYEANKKANDAIDEYIFKVRVIQYGKKLVKLEDELTKCKIEAMGLDESDKKYLDIQEKIEKINFEIDKEKSEQNFKMQVIQDELKSLTIELNSQDMQNSENKKLVDKVEKILEKLVGQDTATAELNRGLEKKLSRIITELVSETDEMAAKLVNDAYKEGAMIQCEYILVRIGDRDVWVDPVRVHN